jgi:predicted nucleic acid-binding protein
MVLPTSRPTPGILRGWVAEGRIIADTGPMVAFLVKEDIHHSWAVEQFKRLPAPFLTCEPVLTEAFYLVHRLKEGKERFFKLLDSGLFAVELELMGEQKALSRLVRKYGGVPMSLADACVVRLAEKFPKASVFTVDGHFRIYRKHGRQVIPITMPPQH